MMQCTVQYLKFPRQLYYTEWDGWLQNIDDSEFRTLKFKGSYLFLVRKAFNADDNIES